MMPNLWADSLLHLVWLLLLPCTFASLQFYTGDEFVSTYPTLDFILYKSPYFNVSGPVIPLHVTYDATDKSCTFQPPPKSVSKADHSIMLIAWKEARDTCKFTTFSQMWSVAQAYATAIQEAGLPPSNTLVVGCLMGSPGVRGNPKYEPYSGKRSGMPDGPPPAELNVAMIVSNLWEKLEHDMQEHDKEWTFHVEQEAGPWNDVFLSIPWRMFRWFVILVIAGGIGYALYELYNVIKEGEFKLNVRNVVFGLDVVGAVLYLCTLVFGRPWFHTYRIMECISSFFVSMAFYLLLYLWSVFLMQVKHSPMLYGFRGVVGFAGVTTVISSITQLVMYNTLRPSKGQMMFQLVLQYWLPFAQVLVASVFAVFALQFMSRRETVKISPHTVAALTRLSQLAVVAFFAFFLTAIANARFVLMWQTTPTRIAVIQALVVISISTRALSILTVLSIRPPAKPSNARTSTKSTA
jgi:hypothetical protein